MDKKTILEMLRLPELQLVESQQAGLDWVTGGGPLHPRVHNPAIDWFEENVLGTDDTEPDYRTLMSLPKPIRIASSCMALRTIQHATGAEGPRSEVEQQSMITFQTLILAGAAMYIALCNGELVFDGELPDDQLGN